MNTPTPAAARGFYRAAERQLRSAYPAGMPQSAQALILNARRMSELADGDLQDFIDAAAGIPREDLMRALAEFDVMFSDPRMRVIETLPDEAAAAVHAILAARTKPACRHILAAAATSAVLPCAICIAHPEPVRCRACHDQHIDDEHDPAAELVCDWCGAQCLHKIFPIMIPLGSILAVRNLAARRTFAVGPAAIIGIGACYRCRRDVLGSSRSIADMFAALESL